MEAIIVTPQLRQKLIVFIRTFIDDYAAISPNYEPEYGGDDKYTGPDPYQLLDAAHRLEQFGTIDRIPFSDWGSGCYKPYSSLIGRRDHEFILTTLKLFQK